jgi:hypothetical protein
MLTQGGGGRLRNSTASSRGPGTTPIGRQLCSLPDGAPSTWAATWKRRWIDPPGVSEEEWRASLPDEPIEEEGRLLLQGLGAEEDMVYAASTTNDHICHALLPSGGVVCGAPGPDGLDLHWVYQPSRPLVVYGLVGDEITSVDVVIAGQTYAARMGENAFGIRVEGAKPSELDIVVLHRRDGTTNNIGLASARPNDG